MTAYRKKRIKQLGITVKQESFIEKYWRPMMAWQYLLACAFDFIINPLVHQVIQYTNNLPQVPWDPITLKAGGFYHIAMGGMIGIYTWVRSLEKINLYNRGIYPTGGYENIGIQYPQTYGQYTGGYGTSMYGSQYVTPSYAQTTVVNPVTVPAQQPVINNAAVPVETREPLEDPRT